MEEKRRGNQNAETHIPKFKMNLDQIERITFLLQDRQITHARLSINSAEAAYGSNQILFH